MGGRRRRPARRAALAAALALALVLVGGTSCGSARASSYPALPIAEGSAVIGNLSGPTILAGDSGTLSLTVQDPLTSPLSSVRLTLDVYAFSTTSGTPTTDIAGDTPPVLSGPGGVSGPNITFALADLSSGTVVPVSVSVSTSSSSTEGTFFVRTALSFDAGGEGYRIESRGWFTASQWANATELPNQLATLNLSRLGVSGVSAETSVIVQYSTFVIALWTLLAVGLVLVAVGTYVYLKRRPQSSSGARRSPGASQAASAFGSNRSKDGD